VTLTWGTGKEEGKGILYNVYSSDDPHAVFTTGWTLKTTAAKKFYCVTAAGSAK